MSQEDKKTPTPSDVVKSLAHLEEGVSKMRAQVREVYFADKESDIDKIDEAVTAAADDPCWDGYKQVGMKKGKGGKMVPNCVPVDAAVKDYEEENPAPEGYHYMPDGELMPDSAHEDEAATKKRTKAQTPAPKKDRIKGSKKNPKGSASGGKKIKFSKAITEGLQNKVDKHNEKAPKGRRATLRMLKAVFRRGAGAYSTSHRPGKSRNQWAYARVNAFLKLLKSGKPSKAAYTQDNDLLPASHPRSAKKKNSVEPMLAGGMYLIPEERDMANAILEVVEKHGKFDQDGDGVWAGYTPAYDNEDKDIGVKCGNCVFYQGGDQCAIIALKVEEEGKCRFAMLPEGAVDSSSVPLRREDNLELLLADANSDAELNIDLPAENTFETTEDAILALTEYSDFGYDAEFAIRASWLRGVRNGEDPYLRAKSLAVMQYDSLDADLLPKESDAGE